MLYLIALAWLAVLGPFFFVTYNAANAYAASLAHVPTLAFAWERHVPFLAWTILPYWSSDLLYAGSLFVSRTREELHRHALRLLVIQAFSVACFVAFPLRIAFPQPQIEGWAETLFGALLSFDEPFNEAPSLHVSLAVILWAHYRKRLTGVSRALAGGWFVLVALSTWTTHRHQFIDLPTGAWAGMLVLAAVPEARGAGSRRVKLALAYLAGSVAITVAAFQLRWWIALWPAFSLSMVAAAYWTGNPAWLSKQKGRIAFWMWPYTLAAWINSRLWTRGQEPWQHLADGVWIGRAPGGRGEFASVLDLTAEMPIPGATHHVPVLDLTVPRPEQIEAALAVIDSAPRPLLVCCALGYSRSATVAAGWLVKAGHAATAEEAIASVRATRPQIVLGKEAAARVQACAIGSA